MIKSIVQNIFTIRSVQRTMVNAYCLSTNICWSCNKPLVKTNKFFCVSCGSLQKVENEDFFNLLDVPKTFAVNMSVLSTNFRRLQSILHPDKFSQKSDKEKLNSLEWSSLVNKAYKTLNVPLERATYILHQKGILIDEENTSVDPEFLSDMMDINEQVEAAENVAELEAIASNLNSDVDHLYTVLYEYFDTNDLDKAKSTLVRLKYLLNIDGVIKEKLLKYKLQ
ncbi:co-chaperone protein HscB homolog [Topomyia yanbarensis]|uniref:co-chaperone protein HscB homolog n=1 Tax=Topomyia yanbarensis TaxID=2498891 RepID=UPI00273B83D2|nr:co-chaperone protein HscB homolog [Topomyia yanbarensis]